uniref:Uncharacterized protein n=1 Tax=Gasterosteus aculeatus TaxID=69293 RepID=G3Q4W0_GASAC
VANMSLAVPLEEQFKCCICLDIFTHPTSIPCGHNFCLECIEGFWDTKRKTECPLCKEKFRERPPLKINCGFNEIIKIYKRILFKPKGLKSTTHLCGKHRKPLTKFCTSDQKPVCVKCTEREHKHHTIVPIEKERNRVKTSLRDKKTSIKQMIHARRRKMEQINNSVDLSLLITAIEKNQARLVEELEQKHQEAERRAAELLQELQQEIRELQLFSEVDRLNQYAVNLSFMENMSIQVEALETRMCFELKEDIFSDLSECEKRSLKQPKVKPKNITTKLIFNKILFKPKGLKRKVRTLRRRQEELQQEIRELQFSAVDVTLDPETASGWLVLSPDRKKVAVGSQKNNLVLDSPRRFNSCVCVSGKQSFATGRRYWVVQVGNKTDWDLGVARESINRKGAIAVRPDSGYWAICRRKGAGLNACAGPSVKLCLKETPQKVGVFLDYDEGLVSFYDAEAKTHIYTYSGCDFNEPLNPYFNPCVPDEGKNIAPLIICPVEESVH